METVHARYLFPLVKLIEIKKNSEEEAQCSEHGGLSEIIIDTEFLEGSFVLFFGHAFYWHICCRETTFLTHILPNAQVSLALRLLCE